MRERTSAGMTVVIAPGPAPALHLCGPLDENALAAALAGLPPDASTLRRRTTTHHILSLSSRHAPAGTVADLLTTTGNRPSRIAAADAVLEAIGKEGAPGPPCDTVPPTDGLPASARQREVLLDVLTGGPGAGLHVGQLHWRWNGPLDTGRFRAAWETVFAQEPVLRAAFADRAPGDGLGTAPRVVVHRLAAPELVRHPHGTAAWHSVLEDERLRAFDLRRPGLLRIALLDERSARAASTRVVLTYHHAMLDGWSVRLLMRTFHRAYLAGGRPTGGERRPDLRDHLRWLAGQDLGRPRAFWSAEAPPAGARTLPARTGSRSDAPDRRGHGLTHRLLAPHEAARLRDWAAGLGATESTALHAAWALLLYRDGGEVPAPAPVAFGMAVSGRGIALEGAAGIPAPLHNVLPIHVDVDPGVPVRRLLAELRDRALDVAAYEWVSAGQIGRWSGRPAPGAPMESLVAFEPPWGARGPDGPDPLWSGLGAEGVGMEPPQAVGPRTPRPIAVGAAHDAGGALLLTAVNDRSRITDPEAAEALTRTVELLRAFPVLADGATSVGQILRAVWGPTPADAPTTGPPTARGAASRPAASGGGLRTLRAAERSDAGTILLVPPPAAADGCYDVLARIYRGPEALATVTAPVDTAACLAAARSVLAADERLILGCFSGGGSVAYDVTRRIAAHGWRPPLVAVAGVADGSPASVRDLARTLRAAAGLPG